MNKCLWEILVPANPDISTKLNYCTILQYHQAWDEKVLKIAGGLSIMKELNGKWYSLDSNSICSEKMIAVRIACTIDELNQIIDMTKEHYIQKEVMVHLVSNMVIIR